MSRGGIRHGRARLPVESCHSLSAWGYFQFAQMWADSDAQDSFEWEIGEQSAVIRFTRDRREHVQEIALTFTPCRFGGRRVWFSCPSCARRVGKVYLPCSMYNGRGQRVTWFRCRFCYGLTYEQRRERDLYWPFLHRAERIAERWFAEVTDKMLYRPKGMHWRTFDRRTDQYNALIEAANGCFMRSRYISWLLRKTRTIIENI